MLSSSVKLAALFLLGISTMVAANAEYETNGQRIARGLPPMPPANFERKAFGDGHQRIVPARRVTARQAQASPKPGDGNAACLTCPLFDQGGFANGVTNVGSSHVFCSYPPITGDNDITFNCIYDPSTGALLDDADMNLCPSQSICTTSQLNQARLRVAAVVDAELKAKKLAIIAEAKASAKVGVDEVGIDIDVQIAAKLQALGLAV